MRGRFAPSPTGYIHLGNVWSAFLAWLQVRQAGGTLVLRIEDIDEQRSKPLFTQALMEDLHWLGLDWDEGPDIGGPYGPYIQRNDTTAMRRPWIHSKPPASCIPVIAAAPACRPSAPLMPASIPSTTAIATA